MDLPNNKARVLLVDDDEDDFFIMRHLISNIPNSSYILDWASSAAEAKDLISKQAHDIYLVDFQLGHVNGLELLEEFNLTERSEPFIILTGANDADVERQAMGMGAADYLIKGTFDSDLLSRVLWHSMKRKDLEVQRIKQLMDLNRSKDEFIAIASHQLRTPATAVKQYVSMVMEGYAGPITEDQQALLQTAYNDNERQIEIVNGILRVAKLDLKKINLNKRKINLVTKIKKVAADLKPQMQSRNQKMVLNLPDYPVYISVDSEYLRMALGNILDNASKYTPDNKKIYITVTEKSNDSVLVTIRDEGVGIAPEDMDKLFKKFSRIDNPLSVKVGGTGLGLYWSKEIIELHNGSIDVQSQLDKGTCFLISLPKNT